MTDLFLQYGEFLFEAGARISDNEVFVEVFPPIVIPFLLFVIMAIYTYRQLPGYSMVSLLMTILALTFLLAGSASTMRYQRINYQECVTNSIAGSLEGTGPILMTYQSCRQLSPQRREWSDWYDGPAVIKDQHGNIIFKQ